MNHTNFLALCGACLTMQVTAAAGCSQETHSVDPPDPMHIISLEQGSTLAELTACCGYINATENPEPCVSYACGSGGECVRLTAPNGTVCDGDPAFSMHGECTAAGQCLWQDYPLPPEPEKKSPWRTSDSACKSAEDCQHSECEMSVCTAKGSCAYVVLPAGETCGTDMKCNSSGQCTGSR